MESELKKLSTVLLEAMQAKGISAEKLATMANISERFVEPLLSDRYDKLPASPYLHGYILKISSLLGLDGEKVWETYFRKNEFLKTSGKADTLPKNRFEKIKIDRRYLAVGVLGILILGYAVWRIQIYFGPPPLSLAGYEDNMVVSDPAYTVKGVSDPKNQLFLNGEQIYPDPSGNFEKKLELQPGFNALSFKVKKFLGGEYTIEKQIFLKTATSSSGRVNGSLVSPQKASENGSTSQGNASSATSSQ